MSNKTCTHQGDFHIAVVPKGRVPLRLVWCLARSAPNCGYLWLMVAQKKVAASLLKKWWTTTCCIFIHLLICYLLIHPKTTTRNASLKVGKLGTQVGSPSNLGRSRRSRLNDKQISQWPTDSMTRPVMPWKMPSRYKVGVGTIPPVHCLGFHARGVQLQDVSMEVLGNCPAFRMDQGSKIPRPMNVIFEATNLKIC